MVSDLIRRSVPKEPWSLGQRHSLGELGGDSLCWSSPDLMKSRREAEKSKAIVIYGEVSLEIFKGGWDVNSAKEGVKKILQRKA